MIKTIEKSWDDFFKFLNYEESLFRDPEQVAVWKDAGHHLPSTSIFVHQKDQINLYKNILKHFTDLENIGVCVHKLPPGHYLPTHIDRYAFYRQRYNVVNVNQVHRYVMFLEDWKDGQYLTVTNKVYSNWCAGDCVGWQGETSHSAINLGIEDRYTLQITGTYEG
jgi:hypothetical protein